MWRLPSPGPAVPGHTAAMAQAPFSPSPSLTFLSALGRTPPPIHVHPEPRNAISVGTAASVGGTSYNELPRREGRGSRPKVTRVLHRRRDRGTRWRRCQRSPALTCAQRCVCRGVAGTAGSWARACNRSLSVPPEKAGHFRPELADFWPPAWCEPEFLSFPAPQGVAACSDSCGSCPVQLPGLPQSRGASPAVQRALQRPQPERLYPL